MSGNKQRADRTMEKSDAPLYRQIKEDLLAQIEKGTWALNEALPTETELCEQYGVSKITVREAVKLLVHEGLLYRHPGKGTFLAQPKLETQLNRFFSFTRWARENGLEPSTRILKVEMHEADQHVAYHLRAETGTRVTHIERLRLGDLEPLMIETIWVPLELCPDLHLQDLANIPLNDILRDSYGVTLVKAVETFEPETADDYQSRMLRLEASRLMLKVEHTTFAQQNKPVYFVRSFYRGDRCRFTIELTAS